ncbi:hypothetical protein V8C34DRAFT_204782 [Trichoderma compactum]
MLHAAYCLRLGLMDITVLTTSATGTHCSSMQAGQVIFPCRSVPCAPSCLSHTPQVATGSSFLIPHEQVWSQSSSREKRKYSTYSNTIHTKRDQTKRMKHKREARWKGSTTRRKP